MKKRNSKPTVAILGAGNAAAAVGSALRQAGYQIAEVVVRDRPESRRRGAALAKKWHSRLSSYKEARLLAEVVLIAVTDDTIAATAKSLAKRVDWTNKIALHLSGARTSADLRALRNRGASVGSLHLMNTFVHGVKPRLEGTFVAIEGDKTAVETGKRLALDIHCQPYRILSKDKVLYHAMGAFASPLLVALLAMAERIGRRAGVKEPRIVLDKLLLQTVNNYRKSGPAAAFSGPINRGDVATVRRHLKALRGLDPAVEIYRGLGRGALQSLPVKSSAKLRKLF